MLPENPFHYPVNLSWRQDSFNSKLPSGLLPPALVRPLTSPAARPVIYVYDHLVGPGCHGQQDGNLLINILFTAFTLLPGFIQTKIMKQYDCQSFISSNNNILQMQEDHYYAALFVEVIFYIREKQSNIHREFSNCHAMWFIVWYLKHTESNNMYFFVLWLSCTYPLQ